MPGWLKNCTEAQHEQCFFKEKAGLLYCERRSTQTMLFFLPPSPSLSRCLQDASGDVPLQPLSMLSQIDLLDADLIDTSDFF
jgi:hypothetical protein